MIERELLAKHLDYSLWASLRVLEAAEKLPADVAALDRGNSFGGIQSTLIHIFQADRLWLQRFEGEPYAPLVREGEQLNLQSLREEWPGIGNRFASWVREQEAGRLSERLFWRNTKGEDKNDVIYKILLHVVNHGTYHRGQVITMIKQAGGEVVSTDLVYYPGM